MIIISIICITVLSVIKLIVYCKAHVLVCSSEEVLAITARVRYIKNAHETINRKTPNDTITLLLALSIFVKIVSKINESIELARANTTVFMKFNSFKLVIYLLFTSLKYVVMVRDSIILPNTKDDLNGLEQSVS